MNMNWIRTKLSNGLMVLSMLCSLASMKVRPEKTGMFEQVIASSIIPWRDPPSPDELMDGLADDLGDMGGQLGDAESDNGIDLDDGLDVGADLFGMDEPSSPESQPFFDDVDFSATTIPCRHCGGDIDLMKTEIEECPERDGNPCVADIDWLFDGGDE